MHSKKARLVVFGVVLVGGIVLIVTAVTFIQTIPKDDALVRKLVSDFVTACVNEDEEALRGIHEIFLEPAILMREMKEVMELGATPKKIRSITIRKRAVLAARIAASFGSIEVTVGRTRTSTTLFASPFGNLRS